MKSFVVNFMIVHKLCMQKYFQCGCQSEALGDHMRKHRKLIKGNTYFVKVLTTSYITMSFTYKVSTSNLAFTKTNIEVEPFFFFIKKNI